MARGRGFLGCGQDSWAAPVLPCALPSGRKRESGNGTPAWWAVLVVYWSSTIEYMASKNYETSLFLLPTGALFVMMCYSMSSHFLRFSLSPLIFFMTSWGHLGTSQYTVSNSTFYYWEAWWARWVWWPESPSFQHFLPWIEGNSEEDEITNITRIMRIMSARAYQLRQWWVLWLVKICTYQHCNQNI